MADIQLDVEAAPNTPAASSAVLYVDSTTKLASQKNDAGNITILGGQLSNISVTTPGAGFSSDTYLTGSNITVPSGQPKVGTMYYCMFDVSKSGAGVAAAVLTVRYGTAGTVADTGQLTFTFSAQTAAADLGTFEIWAAFRTVGASTSAVLQGSCRCTHKLAATGLTSDNTSTLQVTSSGFDSTPAGSIIGVSVNGGASAAWTIALVRAELRSF